jgi:hypothetical protein
LRQHGAEIVRRDSRSRIRLDSLAEQVHSDLWLATLEGGDGSLMQAAHFS